MNEIKFEVDGLPPAKGGELSTFSPSHKHYSRARALLAATRSALPRGFQPMRDAVGLEVVVRVSSAREAWDAANYLAGIADALQNKTRQGRQPRRIVDRLGPDPSPKRPGTEVHLLECGHEQGDGLAKENFRHCNTCPVLPDLGELAAVALYEDDRQLHEVHYRQESGANTCYSVRVWNLEPSEQ